MEKRNGKGKEYNYNGQLEFEGEYLNDEKWNGKFRNVFNNEIIYECEYKNGEKKKNSNNKCLIF